MQTMTLGGVLKACIWICVFALPFGGPFDDTNTPTSDPCSSRTELSFPIHVAFTPLFTSLHSHRKCDPHCLITGDTWIVSPTLTRISISLVVVVTFFQTENDGTDRMIKLIIASNARPFALFFFPLHSAAAVPLGFAAFSMRSIRASHLETEFGGSGGELNLQS